jgi:hypothetical protein
MWWLILGILLGAGALYLFKREDVKLAWYDWLILVVALVFYLLAIENYSGSMAELEPRAAGLLLLSFGLPAVILTAIVGVRVWRNRKTA